jgi:hypothetical protein
MQIYNGGKKWQIKQCHGRIASTGVRNMTGYFTVRNLRGKGSEIDIVIFGTVCAKIPRASAEKIVRGRNLPPLPDFLK